MSSFLAGLTLGSILLGAALVILVLLFLARPFAVAEDEEERIDREAIDALLLRKESLLRDIRELDDDYESAKVAPELYQRARPQMVKQAALIMKRLDEAGYVERSDAPAGELTPDVDARIEAAVRQARQKPTPTPEQLDEQIEAAVKRARAQSAAPASTATATAANGVIRFCPQCGRRVDPDDRFCPKCGHNLLQDNQPAQAARA